MIAGDRPRKEKINGKLVAMAYPWVSNRCSSMNICRIFDDCYEIGGIGGIYTIYDDFDMSEMTDEEKAEIATEFKTSIFDDLVINIKEVFKDLSD